MDFIGWAFTSIAESDGGYSRPEPAAAVNLRLSTYATSIVCTYLSKKNTQPPRVMACTFALDQLELEWFRIIHREKFASRGCFQGYLHFYSLLLPAKPSISATSNACLSLTQDTEKSKYTGDLGWIWIPGTWFERLDMRCMRAPGRHNLIGTPE